MEQWVEIDGDYAVSDRGRVMTMIDRPRGPSPRRAGETLALTPNNRGYLQVKLNRKAHLVSRLVLRAFRGEAPCGHEADHIDRDPSNNRLTNLRWVTRTQNRRNRPDYKAG